MQINDLSIKKKLFIIYFAAILLPLLIMNLLLVSRYQQSISEQYYESLSNEMDIKADKIQEVLSNGYYILQKFYSDRGVYLILDKSYQNDRDFVITYYELFDSSVLSFIPFYEDIQSIIFYTTNSTILNAGSIRFLSEHIRNEVWFREKKSAKHYQVITWKGSNQDDNRSDLFISIIYPLNYYSSFDKYEHLMKVDLKVSAISDVLADSAYKGVMELQDINGETILKTTGMNPKENSYKDTREILDSSGKTIWTLSGYYPNQAPGLLTQRKDIIFFILGLCLLLYSGIVILWISFSLTTRMNLLTGHFQTQDSIKLPLVNVKKQGSDEIGQLINSFNQMSWRINQLVHDVRVSDMDKKQIELDRQKAELHALQSQVNPHYLFNTLETIRMKSVIKGENETAEILQLLSASFRRMFTWDNDLVTIRESLEFLREFLEIQKYRLGDQLSFTIHCSEEIEELLIPKLIMQPIVENCCRHGFRDESCQYKILIILKRIQKDLQIIVEDNGIGMEDSLVEEIKQTLGTDSPMNRFVGIRNVHSRLKSYFGSFFFDIVSRPQIGTRVILQIPILDTKEETS